MNLFEEVSIGINVGMVVGVVHMDFSKAFEKILHGRLVLKLKTLIVREPIKSKIGFGEGVRGW